MFTARYVLHSTFCPHNVLMCFVWIWEQTAIISPYSSDWLVFITETECVYCVVRSAHSVFMYFVWISGETAIISLYSINWLVFITEKECVYCAVRSTFYVLPTQCVYIFCVDLRTNSDYFTLQHWLVGFYNWDGVCLLRGTFYILRSAHTVYVCILCGSETVLVGPSHHGMARPQVADRGTASDKEGSCE